MVDTPARVTPTVSMPIRVDWGSWAEQLCVHETSMAEHAANAGLNLVEGMIPGGFMLKMFAGEQVVNQLVEQGMKTLEGVLAKQPAIEIDPTAHPLYGYVMSMINLVTPKLAADLSPHLDGLIKSALNKVGIAV